MAKFKKSRQHHKRTLKVKTCPTCGKKFKKTPDMSHHQFYMKVYCQTQCYVKTNYESKGRKLTGEYSGILLLRDKCDVVVRELDAKFRDEAVMYSSKSMSQEDLKKLATPWED